MWLWVESTSDTEEEKVKIDHIQKVIESVDNGYKATVEDFYTMVKYFRSLFETKQIIDSIAKEKKKA